MAAGRQRHSRGSFPRKTPSEALLWAPAGEAGRQGRAGRGLGRRGGCQCCATAIVACVADATCQPCSSAWQQHCKHSQAHNVQTLGCGPHLARRLRLRVSWWRGATSGSAAALRAAADAAASGVALRRWQRQGDLRAQHQLIFPLVAATGLCRARHREVSSALPHTTQPLRDGSPGAGPACGLAAAQRLLGRATLSRNAAMIAMLPPPHCSRQLPAVARKQWPEGQQRAGWQVESAAGRQSGGSQPGRPSGPQALICRLASHALCHFSPQGCELLARAA